MALGGVKARAAVAAAAVAVVGAACGGSGGDKAGGAADGEAVVLTLAFRDPTYAAEEYAAAVERLSEGTIRIELRSGWRDGETDYERTTLEDVRRGKVDLADVGVRVWDTLGVTSLRVLVAPFLIDSLALERQVLETPLPSRMLTGVDDAGVVGLAVLPGSLRRPVGISRALAAPKDFEGARIGIRPGALAEAALRAVGASAEAYAPGTVFLAGLDGAEFDVTSIADNRSNERTRALTSNVVLWPRFETVVMNRVAFEALTPTQQDVLRRAGREALGPRVARLEQGEQTALAGLCRRGRLPLVTASAADVAALRRAMRPVYDELKRDPVARELIAEIARLRGERAPPLRCPQADRADAARRVEGVWESAASREELLATRAPQAELDRARAGRWTLELHDGLFVFRGRDTFMRGSYRVEGDVVRLTPAYDRGPTEYRWSRYRDVLTFDRAPGRWFWPELTAHPWKRVP
jgi:TRAP-type C4-dicarboxylate transport system substrate-binding protein